MNENDKIIWVDLDDVLSELVDFVLKKNNYKIWNLPIQRKDMQNYYLHKIDNIWWLKTILNML